VITSLQSGGTTERPDLSRPVVLPALSLPGMVFGRAPAGFHAVSLALHLGVCLLLWVAARRWTQGAWTAELCVLAFALHPVLSEAYFWPSAQPELLMTLGGLGALLLVDRRPLPAAGLFLFGVLAKETLLLALPAFTLWEVVRPEASVDSATEGEAQRPSGAAPALRRVAVLWAAGVVAVGMRLVALGGSGADGGRLVDVVRLMPIAIADGIRGIVGARPIGLRHLSFEYAGLGWGVRSAVRWGCSPWGRPRGGGATGPRCSASPGS
jgi:hypothetical protein